MINKFNRLYFSIGLLLAFNCASADDFSQQMGLTPSFNMNNSGINSSLNSNITADPNNASAVSVPAAVSEEPQPEAAPSKPATQSLDKIVAIVNDAIITQSQVNRAIQSMKQRSPLINEEMSDAELQKKAIDNLINEQLILAVAKAHHVKGEDKEINAALGRIAKKNKLTFAQLKEKVKSEGMAFDKFKEDIRKQLIISKMQHRVLDGHVKVTAQDNIAAKQKYQKAIKPYIQYHALDFVVALPDSPTPEQLQSAHAEAEQLISQLKAGTTFDQIKEEYQDLGWRQPHQLPDVLTKTIVAMQEGMVSAPVQAPNGLHVIKLVETHLPEQGLSGAQLKQLAMEESMNRQLDKWFAVLRKSAFIKIVGK